MRADFQISSSCSGERRAENGFAQRRADDEEECAATCVEEHRESSMWTLESWIHSASNIIHRGSERIEKMCDELVADINALCSSPQDAEDKELDTRNEHVDKYCSTNAYRSTGDSGSSGHTVSSNANTASGNQLLQSLMEKHRNNSTGALSDAIMISSEMGILSEVEGSDGSALSEAVETSKIPSLFQWKVHEKLFLPVSMFGN